MTISPVSPITILPMPVPGNGNGGIVPPWMREPLTTLPTTPISLPTPVAEAVRGYDTWLAR